MEDHDDNIFDDDDALDYIMYEEVEKKCTNHKAVQDVWVCYW